MTLKTPSRAAVAALVVAVLALAPTGSASATPPLCISPLAVNLSAGSTVDVSASRCLLLHVTWATSNASDRTLFLAGTEATMTVDGHPLEFSWVLSRVSGGRGAVWFADAEAVLFSLPPGTHKVAFVVRFTKRVPTDLNLYTSVPAGSTFAAGARVVSRGSAPSAHAAGAPCPAVLAPDGVSYGKARDACRPWGISGDGTPAGTPLELQVRRSLNPDLPATVSRGPAGLTAATADPCGRPPKEPPAPLPPPPAVPPPPPAPRAPAPRRLAERVPANADRHASPNPCERTRPVIATVIAVEGQVTIRRADGTVVDARPGVELRPGDQLVTGPDGLAGIEWTTGGKVGINRGTLARLSGACGIAVDAAGLRVNNWGAQWINVPSSFHPSSGPSTVLGIRG